MSASHKRMTRKIKADCIGILHRLAEVDFDGLENEGNSLRSEERIGLGGPTKLLADGRYPAYATRFEEADLRVKMNQEMQSEANTHDI